MPLQIIRADITTLAVDAIVNPTNMNLYGTAGVDGAVHRKAGPKLSAMCREFGGCRPGEVVITDGYDLPAKYVIHTVGPKWIDGQHGEPEILHNCYLNALKKATKHDLSTIAFPLIATGTFGYPKDQALNTAIETIRDYLFDHELDVTLVVYDEKSYQLSQGLRWDIQNYLDEHQVLVSSNKYKRNLESSFFDGPLIRSESEFNIEKISIKPGLSFRDLLLKMIDQRNLTEPQVYKLANIDRKLFNKIINQKDYHPSKRTVIALAIALKLDVQECNRLLLSAGYALSTSSKFDLIIQWFIEHEWYDTYKIDEALYGFGEPTLYS